MLALATGAAAACSSPPADPAAPVGIAPAATVTLAPVTVAGASQPTLTIPRTAAQVGLRLTGDLGDVEHLTAEVAPAASPDDARRWRADAAPPASDEARVMVTLPAYALPTGEYVLTLWEADARVAGRFAFRVRKD